MRRTVAPATTAPFESVIDPLAVVVPVCARAVRQRKAASTKHNVIEQSRPVKTTKLFIFFLLIYYKSSILQKISKTKIHQTVQFIRTENECTIFHALIVPEQVYGVRGI